MVSVCMATYNGARYIREQIDSILHQLSEKDELIISDDCSTDNTLDIVRSYKDSRIKIFSGTKYPSLIRNFENALMHARGKYIILSDQDDVWAENKVQSMVGHLKECDCVVSDCVVVDANRHTIGSSFFKLNRSHKSRFYNLFVSNAYLGCCMAFNDEVLLEALPFPPGIPMHDIWIGNIAAFNYRLKFIDEKLIYYRRHGNNSSIASEKSKAPLISKLKMRIQIFSLLLKRLIC